jgi:DNA/RNA endonuclease YhcR with UshA esterase domain
MRNPSSVVLLAAAVFGLAACDDGTAPTGEISTVEVRAYVDMDGDNEFTPDFDEAVTDATVTLTPSDGGTPITATTDAAGLATFTAVEPGTYTAAIAAEATPDDAELISQASPTLVAPFEGAALTTEFQYAYNFHSIENVKAMEQGSAVFVYGVVTAGQGTYRDDNIYIQDATSGIQVFGLEPELDLAAGTAVKLRGDLGAFSGEQQIINPFDVTVVGTVDVPEAREVTAPEINDRTYEGELVVTRMARVVTIGGGTGPAYNVTFIDEDLETFAARIEAGVGATVTRDTWEVGAGYDLTGTLGSFNGNAQIKPRSADDIVRVADPVETPDPSVVTIAEARALDDGVLIEVTGVITVATGMHRTQGDNAYIQDATGGLQIFGLGSALEIGDSVRIVGNMDTFHERQITSPEVTVLGTGTVPAPVVLSATAFNSLDHEGELVTIENVTVLSVGEADGSGRYNVTVEDSEGEMQIRIEGGVASTFETSFWTVGNSYDVTGALGQYDGTAQVKPRMASDVEAN